MELSIPKWGNSAAVRLPTELLGMLKVSLDDKLDVDVRPDGVLLKAKRPVFLLADLVAQCDNSTPESQNMAAWNQLKPAGREAW